MKVHAIGNLLDPVFQSLLLSFANQRKCGSAMIPPSVIQCCGKLSFHFVDSGEVTVQKESNYDPTVHLSYGDLAVDNAANPSVISIQQQFDTACNLTSAPQWPPYTL